MDTAVPLNLTKDNFFDLLPHKEHVRSGEWSAWSELIKLSQEMIDFTSRGILDFQQIHLNPEVARKFGLPGTCAFGAQLIGLLPALTPVFQSLDQCRLTLRVVKDSISYRQPVYAGMSIQGRTRYHPTNARLNAEGLFIKLDFEIRREDEKVALDGDRLLLFAQN